MADRQTFLEELQIDQPALDKPAGIPCPPTAGVIHSDFERGFIRAEAMKYQDLIKLGSEQKVKEVGKYMQKGRDYVVEDGDIINFLFNV